MYGVVAAVCILTAEVSRVAIPEPTSLIATDHAERVLMSYISFLQHVLICTMCVGRDEHLHTAARPSDRLNALAVFVN